MPTTNALIYNNNGSQLLGTIQNADTNTVDLKSDGIYLSSDNTLQIAISNFVGLTKTINGTIPTISVPSTHVTLYDETGSDVTYYAITNPNIQISITSNGTTTLATKGTKVEEDIDINVNVPTYITVASESALPSTAQEGTIAVVEGGQLTL